MIIGLGADHGGFGLKEHIKKFLEEKGYEVKDYGTHTEDSVDYPDIAFRVCEAYNNGEFELGILFCGTGIGISIAANKVPNIRCAHCTDTYSARMAKQHNDANIIALGGRITGACLAEEIVLTYLTSEYLGGKHSRRVEKIMNYKG